MEPNEDFHPAVQFLLARIKSHPEDFIAFGGAAKRRAEWGNIFSRVLNETSDMEKAALNRAVSCARLDYAHKDAMMLALNPPEEQRAGSTTEHYAYGFSDPRAAYGSPTRGAGLTLGAVTYDPAANAYRIGGVTYTPGQLQAMGLQNIVDQCTLAQQDATTYSNNTVRASTYDAIKNFIAGSK
jgi:hypothetical protein